MKRLIAFAASAVMLMAMLAACGPAAPSSIAAVSSTVSSEAVERTSFRIAGLKGPTTIGMVKLMHDAQVGEARHDYQVETFGTADEVTTRLIQGELDMAALPANLASVLYNKTEGKVQVAAINTLGVLYVVEAGNTVKTVQDLKGKTVYTTGKGTTPEYVLNYILSKNGLEVGKDLTLEYKSEATEVAAVLKNTPGAVAVLPQPYVTAVQTQIETVNIVLDLTKEWDKVSGGSRLVTGVLVVRTEFAKENPAAFAQFLEDYSESIDYVNANPAEAAEWVAEYGIVEKAAIAQKAIPLCNLRFLQGTEMKSALEGYLQVLYDAKPEAVGGTMPAPDFYFGA